MMYWCTVLKIDNGFLSFTVYKCSILCELNVRLIVLGCGGLIPLVLFHCHNYQMLQFWTVSV